MKTIVYSTHKFDKSYLEMASNNSHNLIFLKDSLNEKTIDYAKGSEAISLFTGDNANSNILGSLSNIGIKYIALRSVGHDNVDLKKCQELGIKVANVPEYSPFSVAEHAMTLILCLNRKIKLSQELIKKQDFRLDRLIGFDMKDKTIGIIGVGKIGATFAKIANGFGCKLLAFDIIENEDLKKDLGIKYVSLEELCTKSDIISLHCPLNDSTRYILNKDKFALMKTGVFIVNTSRGGVIKTNDLLASIDSGKIGGAGLDVYENEKGLFFEDHTKDIINDGIFNSLNTKSNVIITGHQAFLTNEALTNIANTTIYNLDCWSKNKPSKNEIT
jgi:D-lactate dehydrogenase